MIPWWGFALLANVAAIGTEFLYRTQPTMLGALLRALPLIVALQVCLYFNYNRASSFWLAWIVFTVGNSATRLAMAATLLDEPFKIPWAAAGAALMVAASFCVGMATR